METSDNQSNHKACIRGHKWDRLEPDGDCRVCDRERKRGIPRTRRRKYLRYIHDLKKRMGAKKEKVTQLERILYEEENRYRDATRAYHESNPSISTS